MRAASGGVTLLCGDDDDDAVAAYAVQFALVRLCNRLSAAGQKL